MTLTQAQIAEWGAAIQRGVVLLLADPECWAFIQKMKAGLADEDAENEVEIIASEVFWRVWAQLSPQDQTTLTREAVR